MSILDKTEGYVEALKFVRNLLSEIIDKHEYALSECYTHLMMEAEKND